MTDRDLSMFESTILLIEDRHTTDRGLRNMLRILVRNGAMARVLAILSHAAEESGKLGAEALAHALRQQSRFPNGSARLSEQKALSIAKAAIASLSKQSSNDAGGAA